MLVNKTSHKFTGKLGQKVDKTKCGHNYKIILYVAFLHRALTMAPAGVLHTSPLPEHQYKIFLHLSDGGEKEV